ncbi:hypothetical protein [Deinococcus planocerae]|uniref:hypothetical protein n=1 Tax=Deinococcus planocerae TaxID=1737569 RepID=UPI000C7F3E25|nr:hypothetical protein [Deinococcus planocerae]
MNRLALVFPVALTIAACAPAPVRTDDARLTATARTPGGVFAFDCNPALDARRNGVTLSLGGDASVSCPSTDGRATLALTVFAVNSPPPAVPAPVRPVPVPAPPPTPSPVRPVPFELAPGPPPPPLAPVPTTETRVQVLLVVPGTAGKAPLTYSGPTRRSSLNLWNLPWSRGLRGEFEADLGGDASVQGRVNLVAE